MDPVSFHSILAVDKTVALRGLNRMKYRARRRNGDALKGMDVRQSGYQLRERLPEELAHPTLAKLEGVEVCGACYSQVASAAQESLRRLRTPMIRSC
jgi:hypothetical protein